MRKQIVIFVSFAIIGAAGILTVRGQEKTEALKDKRITIQMAKKPLYNVFIRLVYLYDIPIGFEESSLDKNHNDYKFQLNVPSDEQKKNFIEETQFGYGNIKNHLITLDFKDARLEDVLNEIVKQMKNYDWEINDDVVNIFPIKGRDSKFEKLLNIQIRGFGVPKGKEIGMIQPMIVFYLPEIKAFLAENNLYAESDRTEVSNIDRPLPVELEFTDLTFKELLNKITKAKRGGWILRTDKLKKPENKGKEVIEILI